MATVHMSNCADRALIGCVLDPLWFQMTLESNFNVPEIGNREENGKGGEKQPTWQGHRGRLQGWKSVGSFSSLAWIGLWQTTLREPSPHKITYHNTSVNIYTNHTEPARPRSHHEIIMSFNFSKSTLCAPGLEQNENWMLTVPLQILQRYAVKCSTIPKAWTRQNKRNKIAT